MEASELKQIGEWLTEAGVASIEITGPSGSVRVKSAGACAAGSVARAGDGAAGGDEAGCFTQVRVMTVGLFLDAHPLRTAPFVRAGDAVKAGDVVGLVKIGRIYAPIAVPSAGIVSRILVRPGAAVDFGMAVLEIQS